MGKLFSGMHPWGFHGKIAAMGDNLVHIGEVIVHGFVFDPKNSERLRNMDLNKLLEAIPRLFDVLDERGIEYVLVGGIAMLVYVEGRNTQDIDLIVPRDALDKLPEIKIDEINVEFSKGWLEDLQVDFLFTQNQLFEKVRNSYSEIKRFVERDIPCATVEGLLLLKLFALPSLYRQGHFDRVRTYQKDIADLLERYQTDTVPLLEEIALHVLPSELDELQKIVAQIQQEMIASRQRFRQEE